MARYRPVPRSELSSFHEPHYSHRVNNCTCASSAMAIAYDTEGQLRLHAGDIRHKQPDQSGGTSLEDNAIAWTHYGQRLRIRTSGWAGVLVALGEGRAVLLPGKSVYLVGCPSRWQRADHNIFIFPRSRIKDGRRQWEIVDPWGKPAYYQWVNQSTLRTYFLAFEGGVKFGCTGRH